MSDLDDDRPVGRVLSRRDAVRLLAASGAAVLIGCERRGAASIDTAAASAAPASGTAMAAGTALPACVVRPELEVGPFFVDRQMNRSDVRVEGTTNTTVAGAPLALAFTVTQIANGRCAPLAGAMVDIWHCDARGIYSGVNDTEGGSNTVGQTFLRGHQVTDARGAASFTTIYPGWYPGRAVHIHFKVRTPASAAVTGGAGGVFEFTSQLFFDEALTDRVYATAPYAGKGRRDTMNATDGIFKESGGQLQLAVTDASPGYRAAFDIGLDLSDAAVGRPDSWRIRGGGGPRPGARPAG